MEPPSRRTPAVSLKEIFLKASEGLPNDDGSAGVVADALEHLQRGFDAHYALARGAGATDDAILVGDNDYASAVETIAHLDEPRFVEVASRMIRDGAGGISTDGSVPLELWIPHLAGLLDIISEEGQERSLGRIRRAVRAVGHADG